VLTKEKYLTEEQFTRLLRAARERKHPNAVRDHAMLAVGGLCGLRSIELLSIRFCDLHLTDDKPYVSIQRAKKMEKGPDGKRRKKEHWQDVPVPATAKRAMLAWVRTHDKKARASKRRVFPILTRTFRDVFKTYLKRANLSPRFGTHSLRHFRGMQLYTKHKDVNLVKSLLGHSDLASTQVYVHTVDAMEKGLETDLEEPDGQV
jgi:integrase/recombinase XerD